MSFFVIPFIRVFLSKNLYSILYFNIPYRFEHTCPHVLLEIGGLRILSEIRQYLALGANDVDISNFLVEIQEAWFHKVHDQYANDKKVLLKKERILQTIHSRTIIRYPRSGHAKTYKYNADKNLNQILIIVDIAYAYDCSLSKLFSVLWDLLLSIFCDKANLIYFILFKYA